MYLGASISFGYAFYDKNATFAILGAALFISCNIVNGINYMKAYMDADLDFKKNGKFTKYEEENLEEVVDE